ncbi:hypothetical protein [Marinobacter sp. LQ44]|uniref:hypothetical protein n=1 Tax=unclassified Marinobacter TaxID=83889 RepID=UPI000718ECAE|nr:hypothetical protein [Marinobacter sp. LQ44]AMQ87404.1 hypothetical protein ASQ50_01135 [Marinobacter sp. LQ44]
MVRAIVIAGLVAGVIVFALFGSRLLDTAADTTDHPECDLLAGECGWTTEQGEWQVRLQEAEEGAQGMEYVLQVSVPKAPDRFLAVLKGQSMYMGEYPVPLVREAPLEYQARFAAPFCTTGADMIWRIDFQDGQERMENVPWTLVFKAQK